MNAEKHASAELYESSFKEMYLIRRFEERALDLERESEILGPVHVSIGQEAVAVGACANLRDEDLIVSTHRGHHHCIAKGADLSRMFAELMGRELGWARGRGGSMHIVAPEVGIIGTNGIVGAGLPIAVGAAYALAARNQRAVVVCFFGEGASSTGNFGESLNMAGLWKLPVVLICENNQYVELAPANLHIAGEIYRRADGYGIPGERVDGNDVFAVQAAVAMAVERARSGEGPTLIEAMTYRRFGHYSGDQGLYMPAAEAALWRDHRDPIKRVEPHLDRELRERIMREVEDDLDEALTHALGSPRATRKTLLMDSEVLA